MNRPSIEQQITFLTTRNLQATAQFYEDVLGLPLALDQGDCRVYRVAGSGYVGFCQRAQTAQELPGIMLTLITEQVDDWYRYLCERGIAFDKPPVLNPRYNIYHCFLRDPNGYVIEIQRFLDPDWDQGDLAVI